jgi:hypothetical protein
MSGDSSLHISPYIRCILSQHPIPIAACNNSCDT